MNLHAAAVVLRLRTVSEVFDLACRLSTGLALSVFARLFAWVLLPLYAGCLALRFALGLDWWQVWCVAIVATTVAQGPFTIAVGRILFSEQVTVARVLKLFASRFSAYFRALLRFTFLLVVVIWTVVFAPWAYIRMLFLHEVCLLEGVSDGALARRCRILVAGRANPALLVVLLLLLARAGCVLVSELLGSALVDDILQLGSPFGSLFEDGGSPFALLGLFLSVPYVAAARFLQYIDTRTRSDGWDIQLKFMAVASREQPERKAA